MPIHGEEKRVQEGDQEKDAVVITFTNGAKLQLTELKDFFKQGSELELIELAISLLQNVKEERSKSKS